MTGFALADAGATVGIFIGSLEEFAASWWALIPLGLSAAMSVFFLWLFRAPMHKPPRPLMPDDTQAAPWPDGDTVVIDENELQRKLAEGDRRA